MNLEKVGGIGFAALVKPLPGRRRFGVPVGGPFDREAAMIANGMVGRAPDSAVWEVAGEAEFVVSASGSVALVYGVEEVRVLSVREGDRITVQGRLGVARCYVAFGRGARHGSFRLAPQEERPIRLLAGPQASRVPRIDLALRVAPQSDRTGIRMTPRLSPHSIELPSEPACFGAVQLTPGGEVLIVGPDGPTLGGYPKPAVVIDADLDRLSRFLPGEMVEFEYVDLETARTARCERLARLGEFLRLQAALMPTF